MELILQVIRRDLAERKIPASHYSLGHMQNERTCLVRNGEKWSVGYFERGTMSDLREFDRIDDAKNELIARLSSYT